MLGSRHDTTHRGRVGDLRVCLKVDDLGII
jgi:mRNA-degrading endonuclease RelE of RelBE toxin-antitoxin system